MKNSARDTFVVGLRNAHAMEVQARELMERQSERLDDYPEVKAKTSSHLRETNEQIKRLEDCLQACGESTSALEGLCAILSRKHSGHDACDGRR